MGNLFSDIVGEWRTVKVPLYTNDENTTLLITHRNQLIDIINSSDCKLNDKQQHILEKIKDEQALQGGKSRKHRKYKNRTKKYVKRIIL